MAQNLRAARCLLLSFSVSLSLGFSHDALCAPRQPPTPSEEEELVPRFFSLFAAAGYGSDPSERAAWAVRREDGSFHLIPWPVTNRAREASWDGPPPAGVVALIHTHPSKLSPKPSRQDEYVALRLALPVYTISRQAVWKALPGVDSVRVSGEAWFAACVNDERCGVPSRAPAPPQGILAGSARFQEPNP